jgi:hypothetical protein
VLAHHRKTGAWICFVSSFLARFLSGASSPLHPLAEQHRIVANVDIVLAICDQLEQQLGHADQQSRRLLACPCSNASASRDLSRFATPRQRVCSKAWDREHLSNFMSCVIMNL